MESKNITKRKKISDYIDLLTENVIAELNPEQTEEIFDAAKKSIDFFFKHLW